MSIKKNKNTIFPVAGIVLFVMMLSASQAQYDTQSPMINIFLLNQNPDRAKAGDVVEVNVRVQNLGGSEARDILVQISPDYPFSVLEGENNTQKILSLPNWPDDQKSKTLTFKLRTNRDATEGQYPLQVQYSLNNGKSWAAKEFSILVTSKEFAEIIYIDKTKLMPGKETNMTFTINNIGNAPLQNVVFYWNEPNSVVLPVSTDNTRYIRYLDEGASIPLRYVVIASVNAKPDLYNLNLNLQYDIKNETSGTSKETISTKAGIFVGGETDFDVTFSESSAGQTSLSVANVGSTPAMSVTVRVPQQEGYRVQGSTDAVVGNLDKGDYTIVSFQIAQQTGIDSLGSGTGRRMNQTGSWRPPTDSVPNAIPTTMPINQTARPARDLKVVIDYTDTTGVRQSVQKMVPIQFRGAGNETMAGRTRTTQAGIAQTVASWINNYTLIGLAVLVIAVGIWHYYKKKKKR